MAPACAARRCAGGSDWLTNPLNPFLHMYFAVARKTKAGNPLGQNQALTPAEFVALMDRLQAVAQAVGRTLDRHTNSTIGDLRATC